MEHATHGACNHAKGVFVKTIRRGRRSALKAHTGAVDSVWKLVKDAVPASLSTLTRKRPKKFLQVYVHQWQWRHMTKSNVLQATGKRLCQDMFG